jgi:hypothetical protein
MGIGLIIVALASLMFGPPIIFLAIGVAKRNTNKQTAKLFYILAAVYILVGGGICATLLAM